MALRIATIGLGWVVLHRHIPALLRNPAYHVVGVLDRHPGHAEAVARRHKLDHYAETSSLSRISWLNEVDAISIGTAPMAHAALAQEALAMGKHVITEKPFAMTVEEGESMVMAAQKQRRVLAVVHNFQFGRAAKKLADDLAQNRLGPVRRVAAVQLGNPRRRLPAWYEQLPMGLFYDESPHFFYLLRWLSGGSMRLQHAHAVAAADESLNTPSIVSLVYSGAGNIPVTIDCQFDSAISEWHVMVTGEKALGILDVFRDIYLRLPNDGRHALPGVLRTSLCAMSQHALQHVPNGLAYLRGRLDYGNDEVFSRFARAVQGEKEALKGMSAADALAVLKLQHEAVSALRKNFLQ